MKTTAPTTTVLMGLFVPPLAYARFRIDPARLVGLESELPSAIQQDFTFRPEDERRGIVRFETKNKNPSRGLFSAIENFLRVAPLPEPLKAGVVLAPRGGNNTNKPTLHVFSPTVSLGLSPNTGEDGPASLVAQLLKERDRHRTGGSRVLNQGLRSLLTPLVGNGTLKFDEDHILLNTPPRFRKR